MASLYVPKPTKNFLRADNDQVEVASRDDMEEVWAQASSPDTTTQEEESR